MFDLIEHKWVCENDHESEKTTTIGTTTTTINSATTNEFINYTTSQPLTSQSTSDELRISFCIKLFCSMSYKLQIIGFYMKINFIE